MTDVRSFDRQVRPVRAHLPVARGAYLCGYVQRPADLELNVANLPICGACVVAFLAISGTYEQLCDVCLPPDIDAATSVALLQETEWGPRLAGYPVSEWLRQVQTEWAAWRTRG